VIALLGFRSCSTKWQARGALCGAVLVCAAGVYGIAQGLPRINVSYDHTQLTDMDEGSMIAARGSGSLRSRLIIYMSTIDQAGKSPWIGYGTQRSNIAGMPYPAGSHSTYLSILYKFGAAGLLVYLLLYAGVFGWLLRALGTRAGRLPQAAVVTALLVFMASAFHQLLEELDLDASVYHLTWLTLGALMCVAIQNAPAARAQALVRDL
jgi:O-antigen ligase